MSNLQEEKRKDSQNNLAQALNILQEMQQDNTISKNVRLKVSIMQKDLEECPKEELSLKINKILSELEELSNDMNLPMFVRTQIWTESSPPAIRGILCAIDFSAHAALALSTAALIARRAGLDQCLAMHVLFEEPSDGRDRAQAEFERFLAPIQLHGVRVRLLLQHGPSVVHAAARLAESDGLDLVVMGTRGQSRSTSILLGSESEQTLMETPIPVLAVKQRGERLSLLEALFDREFSGRAATHSG